MPKKVEEFDEFEFSDEERKEKEEYKESRVRMPVKKSIRNLWQYRNLTDEEFNEKFGKLTEGIQTSQVWEDRIADKIKQFGEDYDLDELNSNDKLLLRSLAQSFLSLEDFELITYNIRQKSITYDDLPVLEKLSKIMTDLRSDISSLQNDLKITRKLRKSDKEQSVIAYIEELKEKAREFYEQKMMYIFCPKCDMLLGTFWTLYPNEEKNKIKLVCNRVMEDGETCGEVVILGTKELLESGSTNKKDIPEAIK
jgi:hypothetical protein